MEQFAERLVLGKFNSTWGDLRTKQFKGSVSNIQVFTNFDGKILVCAFALFALFALLPFLPFCSFDVLLFLPLRYFVFYFLRIVSAFCCFIALPTFKIFTFWFSFYLKIIQL